MPKFPVLTPSYSSGIYRRTSASISVGSSRSKIGLLKRIQSHNNAHGRSFGLPPCAPCCHLTGAQLSNCLGY